jgi:hypothetical protein
MAAGRNKIQVSGIWWLWIVTTIPLTIIVVLIWWRYKVSKEKVQVMPLLKTDGDNIPFRQRIFSTGGRSISGRHNSSTTLKGRSDVKDYPKV